MIRISAGPYAVSVSSTPDEPAYSHASGLAFWNRLESEASDREYISVSMTTNETDRALIVDGWYSPGPRSGFYPSVLIVPETAVAFVGAGIATRSYSLASPALIEEYETEPGFWGWRQHGDLVVMSAELELAVWTVHGKKLWSCFVEPSWDYKVNGQVIEVDVMGKPAKRDSRSGAEL